MPHFRKSSYTSHEHYDGKHRFEHWYRDNTVYFITSKVRDGAHLFATQPARDIFWDRFNHYTAMYGFTPWVTTLMHNHWHTEGYLREGEQLGEMMRKIHGSIAMMVMKTIGVRHVPFWRERGNRDYFDGCLRDVLQGVRTYRYVLSQSVRVGIVRDFQDYPDTRINVEMWRAIKRAVELNAFMEGVPYARYEKHRARTGHRY